ncbi:hypothetical protein L861_23125 [Litchfieldella anticariensis FP35 = DSM 16096]|uniref:Uncharacterized protein n=1 Tax=Litchfieldella anticariensis (strain DSM 16096 / CECT 5854 / CIP 108499 / LMG 22089 / FP35) TaxID=1121939 RepID=S2L627_LITA3|nr:hypothetical protein L861_23125 [Halomonas anticariensis FP35 = DSM 16096]
MLPENISLQLSGFVKEDGSRKAEVAQLASSLGSFYASNQRELSELVTWGLLFGILGAAIGVISWVL